MAHEILQDMIDLVLDSATENEEIVLQKYGVPSNINRQTSENNDKRDFFGMKAERKATENSPTRFMSASSKNKFANRSIFGIKKKIFTKNRLDSANWIAVSTKNSSKSGGSVQTPSASSHVSGR